MKCRDCLLQNDCKSVMEANGKKLDLEKVRTCRNYVDESKKWMDPSASTRTRRITE